MNKHQLKFVTKKSDNNNNNNNETHRLLQGFEIQMDHLITARRPNLEIVNKKRKKTCRIVDFGVLAYHGVKLKESEKIDKYLDLAREKGNMTATVIPNEIVALGTVTKGSVQELEELEIRWRAEIIQTTPWLRSARILRRTEGTWGDLLSLKLQWEANS